GQIGPHRHRLRRSPHQRYPRRFRPLRQRNQPHPLPHHHRHSRVRCHRHRNPAPLLPRRVCHQIGTQIQRNRRLVRANRRPISNPPRLRCFSFFPPQLSTLNCP